MKWFLKIFAVAVLGVFLNGCIEMHTVVTVKKDGSGFVEENISVGQEIIKMFKEFASAFADSTQPQQEFNLFEEEKIKAKTSDFGEGVEFVSMEKISTDEKEGYKAIYKFKNLNNLKLNQDPSDEMPMSEPKEDADPISKLVQFKFTKGKPNRLVFRLPDDSKKEEIEKEKTEETTESTAEQDSVDMTQMVKFMKDMRAKIEIKIDGEITNTNATHVDGNTITLFDIDFGKLIADADKLEQFKKFNPDSFEEVKKLVKDIPGIKVELNKEVFIEFE